MKELGHIAVSIFAFGATLGFIIGLAMNSGPSPTPPPPAPSAHVIAMSRKNAAIDRCERNDAGVAVIGFGTKVVCVKPMWVEDPEFPREP